MSAALVFLGIVFLLLSIFPAYADEPSEPHHANAMWVEPSTINLNTYTVGQKFNVTVWVNMSTVLSPAVGIDTWQVKLYYDLTYIKALRTGYTAGTTSKLFQGLSTVPVSPLIESNFTYHGETCATNSPLPYLPVPCHGSLMWIEFNVTAVTPKPIHFQLNITNEDNWVADDMGNYYPPDGSITQHNGIVIPEFSPLLIVSLMVLTLVAVTLNKKSIRKPNVYQTKTSH
jgi:hypothetical protein